MPCSLLGARICLDGRCKCCFLLKKFLFANTHASMRNINVQVTDSTRTTLIICCTHPSEAVDTRFAVFVSTFGVRRSFCDLVICQISSWQFLPVETCPSYQALVQYECKIFPTYAIHTCIFCFENCRGCLNTWREKAQICSPRHLAKI